MIDPFRVKGAIFRALVEHALEGMIVVDSQGQILFENVFIQDLLGHSATEFIGRNVLQSIHPDDVAQVRAAFERTLTAPEVTPILELRMSDCEHRWRRLEAVIRGLVHDGERLRLLYIRSLGDRGTQSGGFKAVDRMNPVARRTAAFANDFEHLFSTICFHIDAMLKSDAISPRSLGIRAIKRAGEVGLALTRQFLAIQDMAPAVQERVDVNAMLRNLFAMLDPPPSNVARLRTVLRAGRPVVFAARAKLEYVVMSLIVTMRDAMPAGSILTITTSNVSVRGEQQGDKTLDYLLVEVNDAAGQMPYESRTRIMDPASTIQSGAGEELWLIGRAIMYDVVQGMGGFIEVDAAGVGITYRLFLPLHEGA